ncbi:helix-turn-helix domain-containing protein [Ancrocorticia sp.]|uniref:helix-turn-helix domain-containing protein n=1 Tax=Ancrocorticia sp. TaxID=2593684 RepID=UPI003F8EBDCF
MVTDSSYIPLGHAIRRARLRLEFNQHEFADRLNSEHGGNWSQVKVSRVEAYGRELNLQELMTIVDVLGIDALRGTYEMDQILGVASEYAQSLKTAMLDAIDGLESAHKALTDGLS